VVAEGIAEVIEVVGKAIKVIKVVVYVVVIAEVYSLEAVFLRCIRYSGRKGFGLDLSLIWCIMCCGAQGCE
jgi:hypothetical protein